MYDLGILGRMGSKATATLFNLIVDNTAATKDQEHLDVIVLNKASLPDRTSSILTGTVELLNLQLKDAIKQLNAIGVKKYCHSLQYYTFFIQRSTSDFRC